MGKFGLCIVWFGFDYDVSRELVVEKYMYNRCERADAFTLQRGIT